MDTDKCKSDHPRGPPQHRRNCPPKHQHPCQHSRRPTQDCAPEVEVLWKSEHCRPRRRHTPCPPGYGSRSHPPHGRPDHCKRRPPYPYPHYPNDGKDRIGSPPGDKNRRPNKGQKPSSESSPSTEQPSGEGRSRKPSSSSSSSSSSAFPSPLNKKKDKGSRPERTPPRDKDKREPRSLPKSKRKGPGKSKSPDNETQIEQIEQSGSSKSGAGSRCPYCHKGWFRMQVTTAGYIAAILLFPIGTICCLSKCCCAALACSYCGHYFHLIPIGAKASEDNNKEEKKTKS